MPLKRTKLNKVSKLPTAKLKKQADAVFSVKRGCKECEGSLKGVRKGRTLCSMKCYLKNIKKDSFKFQCCICQKDVYTQPTQIFYRHRKTCSMACRGKLVRQRAEKKRIGYTKHQLDRLARYSPEAEMWRKAVFDRDDYTCQTCGIRGTYLEADHIKPFAYFPELRFELSNGRTLCRSCHDKTKLSAKRMREIYAKV